MSGWRLTLKRATPLRLDLRSLSPAALAGLSADAVARLTVWHGTEGLALGDVFNVESHGDDSELVLDGDLTKADRIGWQLAAGSIRVDGDAGDYLGCGMSGGSIVASGNAGLLAACEMAGGRLEVRGSVGDFAASALPGSMDGMRGGVFLVQGSAGARFGDRMRRGSALVAGDAGDFLASRMVAGSIVVAGRIGAHCAHGMRRGTVIAAGAAPTLGPTFARNGANIGVFWQLVSRDLATHGGAFASLAQKRPQRWVGDIGAGGKGEVLVLG